MIDRDDWVLPVFNGKKLNQAKLIPFGFHDENGTFVYKRRLEDSNFLFIMEISQAGEIKATVIDTVFDEPYTLHLAYGALGSFAAAIRKQYEDILYEIAENCFEPDLFQCFQTKEIIDYVADRYGDTLEFLWKKFPGYAVWRRKDTGKWYGVILTVPKYKLGIESEETVEIIDLRIEPEKMEGLIDHRFYFPGWHMNKKHWYTMILDGSIDTQEICQKIDDSYVLAKK